MATAEFWAGQIDRAEQRIVNVAYGLSTESSASGVARQIERLCEAVRMHHEVLEGMREERPTLAYEVAQIKRPSPEITKLG